MTGQKSECGTATFHVAGKEFGISLLCTREVIGRFALRHVPNSPQQVAGIISLRGRILPVIDLAKSLGLEGKTAANRKKIIVCDIGKGRLAGILVDDVGGIIGQESPAPKGGMATITIINPESLLMQEGTVAGPEVR